MRKRQQELFFEDSSWKGSNTERDVMRSFEAAGRETDISHNEPLPERRRHLMKVVCLECSTKFTTRSHIPSCPGCGGSDIELR